MIGNKSKRGQVRLPRVEVLNERLEPWLEKLPAEFSKKEAWTKYLAVSPQYAEYLIGSMIAAGWVERTRRGHYRRVEQ